MAPPRRQGEPEDRYEPLPPVTKLPAWVWRRMGVGARVALGVAVAGLCVLGVYMAPRIDQDKRDERARQQRQLVADRAAQRRRIIRIQRPRRVTARAVDRTSASPQRRRTQRRATLSELGGAILADARRRSPRPVKRVSCHPAAGPDAPRPEYELSRSGGGYRCTAVTSDIPAVGDSATRGQIGVPYLGRVDYSTGRMTFCQIAGVAGEGSYRGRRAVQVPRACTGG